MILTCCFCFVFSRKAFFFVFPGLIVFFFGLSPTALALSADPLSAVAVARQGIEQADVDLFNQAVDVDAVLNRAFNTLNKALREHLAADTGNDAVAVAAFFTAATENAAQDGFLRQLVISEMKGFVAAGINGGYFAGKPNGLLSPGKGILSALLPKLSQGRKELIPGKVLSQHKDKAVVSATFVDAEAGSFPLTLALQRRQGNWLVTEVVNAAQLLDEAVSRGR
jgi:hypothetical protein